MIHGHCNAHDTQQGIKHQGPGPIPGVRLPRCERPCKGRHITCAPYRRTSSSPSRLLGIAPIFFCPCTQKVADLLETVQKWTRLFLFYIWIHHVCGSQMVQVNATEILKGRNVGCLDSGIVAIF